MPVKKPSAAEKKSWPRKTVVPLERPYLDARGGIQSLVDDVDMKSALIISSKKGSLRANHYHRSDWHYCYVISGEIEYFERPVGSKARPKRTRINAGQLFFTPPMAEHAMKFPKHTVFLTLSRNARDPKHYEDDLVRVELVKP